MRILRERRHGSIRVPWLQPSCVCPRETFVVLGRNPSMTQSVEIDVEAAVKERYSDGAQACEASLCCPVSYNKTLLEAIPDEVIERDYGCGDPSRYITEGETVLDLGSGSGKACFIMSQVVGPAGKIIGADMNDDMLALARGAAPVVAKRIGHDNVHFVKSKIQDLRLDCEKLDRYLVEHPAKSHADWERTEAFAQSLRRTQPAVADGSVDVVVSNCVLNLVRPEDKAELFRELFRVLKKGGRAVISDIVSDEDIPLEMQNDEKLWSGCISGAYREDAFLDAFKQAGFHGMALLERVEEPWQTVQGIEFRSVTVIAYKGKAGPRWDTRSTPSSTRGRSRRPATTMATSSAEACAPPCAKKRSSCSPARPTASTSRPCHPASSSR